MIELSKFDCALPFFAMMVLRLLFECFFFTECQNFKYLINNHNLLFVVKITQVIDSVTILS